MARVEYLVCLLCGMNRVVRSHKRADKGKPEIVRFNHGRLPEMEELEVLQIREGGGKQPGTGGGPGSGKGSARGIGFRKVGGMTLEEMMEDPEYDSILEDLKAQYLRQLRGLIRVGFISTEELK